MTTNIDEYFGAPTAPRPTSPDPLAARLREYLCPIEHALGGGKTTDQCVSCAAADRIEADSELLRLADAALRDLQCGTAHPDDPVLKGDMPCWCEPRNMFVRGAHDDACLAANAFARARQEGEQ